MSEAPFHDGELLAQERAGERYIAERTGQIIADHITPPAQALLRDQRLLLAASVDVSGQPWASALIGPSGFATTHDGSMIDIDLRSILRAPEDPLWRNLDVDTRIGLLAIEFATRKRVRINGDATRPDEASLRVTVREAYPNCPQYIQRRDMDAAEDLGAGAASSETGERLSDELLERVRRADTFFVASANPQGGVDVSHRGGSPGFVGSRPDGSFRIPDYRGNGMFNTLGNLLMEPRAGLLFIDFEGARLLQIAGATSVEWDGEDAQGTGRSWTFRPRCWIESSLPAPVRWRRLDAPPERAPASDPA